MVLGKICAFIVTKAESYRRTKIENRFANVTIGKDSVIRGNVEIGAGTNINYAHIIAGPNSKIRIGENCQISYNVHIRAHSKKVGDLHSYTDEDIVIGNNVWVGVNVFIKPGITIGDNSVIGANTVVTKDVPERSLATGGEMRITTITDK
ncbi:MAG: acyltransferase [Promethearchaeota archaeon]